MENGERIIINELFSKKYADPAVSAGYGITATVFINGDAATKVYSKSIPKNEVFLEAYMLSYVERVGIETSKVRQVSLENGYWVMSMSSIEGVPMLRGLFEKLLSSDFTGATADVERMAEIHADINKTGGLGLPTYKNYAASIISGNPALTDECKKKLLYLLNTLPDGNALCHGDFHPNNILVSPDGRWTVIDWPEVTSGSPCADACRTYVNMSRFTAFTGFVERAPDASELYENINANLLNSAEKPDLMAVYLGKYCELMNIPEEEILRWLPIQAGMLYGYKEEDICSFLKPHLP